LSKMTSQGYVLLTGSRHPLARFGVVGEHRVVLYDKIGPGTHSCYWCGTPVTWMARSISDPHKRGRQLCVDHLNRDKSDNDPANLIPSCTACSTTRHAKHCVAKRVLRRELWRKERSNASWYKLFLECGHSVVRRNNNAQRAWCYVCAGNEEPNPPEKRIGFGAEVRAEVVPDGGYAGPTSIGPMRRVVKELGYAPSTKTSGYTYMYLLKCGHEVTRRKSGVSLAACPSCREANT
jgi:hypothetical protein